MGIENSHYLFKGKLKGTNRGLIGGLSGNPRFNPYRLKKSYKFREIDSEVKSRLDKLLNDLLSQINGYEGCITISLEEDQQLVKQGHMPPFVNLDQHKEGLVFCGNPLQSKNVFIEPILVEKTVIGYIYVKFPESQNSRMLPKLIAAHARIASKELELTVQKESLNRYFSMLMRKKEELEKTQEYNKNLLNITSHDISSPLSAVSGYLELMEEGLRDEDEADLSQMQHYRRQIYSGIQDISEIIKQLTEITDLKCETKSLNFINVDINWIVRDICERLEIRAEKEEKKLIFHSSRQPAHVKVDIIKLKRILYNLITNGIKYTAKEGIIEVSVTTEGDHVYAKISDNGIGISDDDQQRIFEPFTKLSDSESDADSSCGLGLFVSSYFAKLMDGHITVKSKPESGSVFTLALPKLADFDTDPEIVDPNYP